MPLSINRIAFSSLPLEQFVPTIGQSSGPVPPSPQDIQAAIQQGIQKAAQNFRQNVAQNFGQGVGATAFTITTSDTGAAVHFGDGSHGAQLPSGSSGAAVYRTGSGDSGNQPTPDPALWIAIRSHTAAIR